MVTNYLKMLLDNEAFPDTFENIDSINHILLKLLL